MLIIYGKGEMGKGVKALCDALGMPARMMDDEDRDDDALAKSGRIVVTPGISPKHKLYEQYGAHCIGELDFIARLREEYDRMSKIVTIGITGTKGKSTTTRMTYNLLKAFAPAGWNVHITGNFKVPVSQTLANIMNAHQTGQNHLLVIESSSFMLRELHNFFFEYGIRTNFSPDHLDRHPSLQDYFASKAKLVIHTREQVVVDHAIFATLSEGEYTLAYTHEYKPYPASAHTQFLGEHNARNRGAAIDTVTHCIQKLRNLTPSHTELLEKAQQVAPLEHRLQLLMTLGGIDIFDDNNSTNSASQRTALESFDHKVVLIAGGSDKGDDFNPLASLYHEKVGFGILYGFMAPVFARIFTQQGIPHQVYDSFEDAIQDALPQAQKGNMKTVLFSPGCASFDLFKNYYERADRFLQLMQGVKENFTH